MYGITLLLLFLIERGIARSPPGYSPIGPYFYRAVSTLIDYYTAQNDCRSDGGDLFMFKTEEDLDHFKPVIGKLCFKKFMISPYHYGIYRRKS